MTTQHFQEVPLNDSMGPYPPGTERSIESDSWTYRVKDFNKTFPIQNYQEAFVHRQEIADWCWSAYFQQVNFCAVAEKLANIMKRDN